MTLDPLYSDIDLDVVPDSSGRLKLLRDLEAVAQSIDTILMTSVGTRKFVPEFGSSLQDLLFEQLTDGIAILISEEVRRAILRWDPRVAEVAVKVTIMPDESTVVIMAVCQVRNVGTFNYVRRAVREAA